MSSFRPSTFLRNVLLADALISGATGLLMVLGAGFVTEMLGLPETLLRFTGLSLLPFAAVVAWLATREASPRGAVWAVIAFNAAWAIDSIVLLLSGWVAPTALGLAFTIAQALAVLILAELQYIGLRRFAAAVA